MMNSSNLIGKKIAGSAEYFLRKHGPALLTAAGVGGFIASTALTGRAVLKSQDKIRELKEKHDKLISERDEQGQLTKEQTRELARVWVRDGLVIAKDFAPAITTGSLAIICVISSHRMMQNKQTALAAAYSAVDAAFKAYRKRVEAEVGPEKETEIYRNVRMKEGTDPELPCEIDYSDVNPSIYSRFFDDKSRNWTKTPEYNMMFLRAQQDWANDRLRAYGFIFLNEVYEALGLDRSQAGQIVGWKLGNGGDNFVDFGLYEIGDEASRAFINGIEHTILLDFNVDGPITI